MAQLIRNGSRRSLRGFTFVELMVVITIITILMSMAIPIYNRSIIRAKESDRIGMLAHELRKCGITVIELDDGLRIEPGFSHGAALETYHDHRLAMAFGVMGLGLAGVRVHDPDVVSKSWPDFWTVLEGLRPST